MMRLLIAGMILTACCATAAPVPPFVDCSRAQLIQAVPELSNLEFAADQSSRDPLLRAAGEQLEAMFAKFVNVSFAEDVHEMRFDAKPLLWREHRVRFQYAVETHPFAELRRQTPGGDSPDTRSDFLLARHFIAMLGDLLPENQGDCRYRYLGRIAENGSRSLVVAFLADDGSRQGLAWLDEATTRVLRLRTDVLKPAAGEEFESFTRDERFVAVSFPARGITLWLPSAVTAHLRFAAGELHTIDRFSDYRVGEAGKEVGEAAAADREEDAYEILLKGVTVLAAGNPADAIAPLREAAGRLPERVEPAYYLGLALYRTHDFAGAEAQFRETIKRAPAQAAAHNELGAVLFARGERAGAIAEFQEAIRLEPGNAKMLANLDQATRAPANGAAAAPSTAPTAGDVTIKVDVRQVLVPVVVTDKEGHHATGLVQSDFKVFEDGVEQTITSFTSERSDVSSQAALPPEPVHGGSRAAGPEKPLATRLTYVICLDMLHSVFSNFVYVRRALEKLFQQEQAGDSQYLVIALGRGIKVVQPGTSSPAKVLETVSGPDFQKLFQKSAQSSSQAQISIFERELQEARSACDQHDPSCKMLKQPLPLRANAVEQSEEFDTREYLAELRSVVEQVSRGDGRRTMVLISDGFLMAPGKIPFGLLETYFPEYRSTRSLERVQDSLDPIFRAAAKGNVPIYTVDARGLYTLPGYDASRTVSMSVAPQVDRMLSDIATDQGLTLSEIAAATGGTAFHNSNDLFSGLSRALADGREYYLLGYTSSKKELDGKFRKIAVSVRDKKDLVSAKRGYWASN